mmetsp:Transcript_30148/g.34612  ORF Transcript_30148/g.34612 Transcript_30148/m.34612 type:complete len:89 (-) Transcript_30148:44-310(-)
MIEDGEEESLRMIDDEKNYLYCLRATVVKKIQARTMRWLMRCVARQGMTRHAIKERIYDHTTCTHDGEILQYMYYIKQHAHTTIPSPT